MYRHTIHKGGGRVKETAVKLPHPNGTELHLSDDLLWTDEFEWSALAQAEPERTLSGAQVVQQSIKRAGRPVTLAPPIIAEAAKLRAKAEHDAEAEAGKFKNQKQAA